MDSQCATPHSSGMNINQRFGANVRRLREIKGWSQETLAEAAELHRTYISGIENATRNPTLMVIERLARALGVAPSELLAGEKRR